MSLHLPRVSLSPFFSLPPSRPPSIPPSHLPSLRVCVCVCARVRARVVVPLPCLLILVPFGRWPSRPSWPGLLVSPWPSWGSHLPLLLCLLGPLGIFFPFSLALLCVFAVCFLLVRREHQLLLCTQTDISTRWCSFDVPLQAPREWQTILVSETIVMVVEAAAAEQPGAGHCCAFGGHTAECWPK